jgi:hypothetical protein
METIREAVRTILDVHLTYVRGINRLVLVNNKTEHLENSIVNLVEDEIAKAIVKKANQNVWGKINANTKKMP